MTALHTYLDGMIVVRRIDYHLNCWVFFIVGLLIGILFRWK